MTTEERIELCHNSLKTILPPAILAKLLHALKELNFFTSAASTKYHGNYMGGLFDHSFAVMKHLVYLTDRLGLIRQDARSPYIVGLLHDLCKCDQYKYDAENNKYVWVPSLLPGHGEKSIILAQQIITDLTEEEILCIRWHMGAFDDKDNWDLYGKSIEKYPNVLFTHTADMMAARIDGI